MVSGSGTVAVKKVQKRFEEVGYLSWIKEFIKPRQSRGTLKEQNYSITSINKVDDLNQECFVENELDESYSTVQKTPISNAGSTKIRKRKNESPIEITTPKYLQKQEEKEMAILQKIGDAAAKVSNSESEKITDEIEILGELVVQKLRKLSEICDPDESDDVQDSILEILKNVRRRSKPKQQIIQGYGGQNLQYLPPPLSQLNTGFISSFTQSSLPSLHFILIPILQRTI